MAQRRFNKSFVIGMLISVPVCVGLIVYIVFSVKNINSTLSQNNANGLNSMMMQYYDAYENAIQNAKDKNDVNQPNIKLIPFSKADTMLMFPTSLGAANIDASRVYQKPDGQYVYLIAHGDTLTSISAAFGYSVDLLADYNAIRDVNLIYANSSLQIPK